MWLARRALSRVALREVLGALGSRVCSREHWGTRPVRREMMVHAQPESQPEGDSL